MLIKSIIIKKGHQLLDTLLQILANPVQFHLIIKLFQQFYSDSLCVIQVQHKITLNIDFIYYLMMKAIIRNPLFLSERWMKILNFSKCKIFKP